MFNRRFAARDARKYREHGVSGSSRTLVELAGDVRGASVLDIGGGVGAIGLELLGAGAEHATNVEISSGYEEAAEKLIEERGVAARVDRRVTDIVDDQAVEPHDVVVMHPVAGIVAAAESHGLQLERRVKHGLLWESASLAR